mmetsp:Transcript_7737/g.23242  ORF Transcript_7737/g.23242 Transcript_7737/m.23242 type:complete len:220 (-) Transcript_7737:653-1312(-)
MLLCARHELCTLALYGVRVRAFRRPLPAPARNLGALQRERRVEALNHAEQVHQLRPHSSQLACRVSHARNAATVNCIGRWRAGAAACIADVAARRAASIAAVRHGGVRNRRSCATLRTQRASQHVHFPPQLLGLLRERLGHCRALHRQLRVVRLALGSQLFQVPVSSCVQRRLQCVRKRPASGLVRSLRKAVVRRPHALEAIQQRLPHTAGELVDKPHH